MSCPRAFPRLFSATLSLRQPFRPAAAPCQGLPKPPPLIACDAPALARRRQFAALRRRLAAPVSLSLVSPSVRSRIKEEPGGPPNHGVASGSFSAARLGQRAPGKHRAARRLRQSVLRARQPRPTIPDGLCAQGEPLARALPFAGRSCRADARPSVSDGTPRRPRPWRSEGASYCPVLPARVRETSAWHAESIGPNARPVPMPCDESQR